MRSNLLIWDLAAVGVFVVLGRETHEEGLALSSILATAAPFTGALVAGWLVALRWDPTTIRGGVVVLIVTVVGGMLLRRFVANEGTATPFVIVTTLFMTATLIGWRLAAAWRRSARNDHAGALT